jgi:hypothetical protein
VKTRLLQFLSLTLAFVAGAFSYAWFGRLHAVPPPALKTFDEFFRDNRKGGKHELRDELTPGRIAELNRRLEELKPQMDAFRARYASIEAEFHGRFLAILNPKQRQKLASIDPGDDDMDVFPDRQIRPDREGVRGLPAEILRIIAYRPHLARLVQQLKLSDSQRRQLRDLLDERRARFIALVDDTPPPSLEIGQMIEPDAKEESP